MKSIFVLMVSYKRLNFLRQTINSLLPTMPEGSKLLVVDNASGFDVTQYLDEVVQSGRFGNMVVRFNEINRGYGMSVNEALKVNDDWKEYEYTMIVNNDETFEQRWYEVADVLMRKYPKIGLLGLWRHPHHGTIQDMTDMDIRDNAPGVAWLFRSKDLERFLPFPEHGPTKTVGGNGEDVGMTHRVMDTDMWIAAPRNDLVHHIEGYKLDALGKDNPEYL